MNRSKLFDKTSPLEQTFPLGDILAIVCHGSTLGRAIDGQGHVPFPPLRHVHANWRLVRVEGNAVGVTLQREITILMRVEYRRMDPKVSPDGFQLW